MYTYTHSYTLTNHTQNHIVKPSSYSSKQMQKKNKTKTYKYRGIRTDYRLQKDIERERDRDDTKPRPERELQNVNEDQTPLPFPPTYHRVSSPAPIQSKQKPALKPTLEFYCYVFLFIFYFFKPSFLSFLLFAQICILPLFLCIFCFEKKIFYVHITRISVNVIRTHRLRNRNVFVTV